MTADNEQFYCDVTIPGVDVQLGFAHYGLDEEQYLGILRSYAADTRHLLEATKEVTAETLSAYRVTVHGLKGASSGIFASETAQMAKDLEMAAIAGDLGYVQAHNGALVAHVTRLVDAIEAALSAVAPNKKPLRDKPDPVLLSYFLSAINAYDIDGMDTAMAGLSAFDYEADDGLIEWLREHLAQGQYVKIKAKLLKLREQTEEDDG